MYVLTQNTLPNHQVCFKIFKMYIIKDKNVFFFEI